MQWKKIDGYKYEYRISEEAEVQKRMQDGTWKPIQTWVPKRARDRLTVNLATDAGYRKTAVCKLMEGRFIRPCKPGEVLTYRNGLKSDCSAWNLVHATKKEINKKIVARKKMKPVEKVGKDGNVVDVYKSITDAAGKNFASRRYVSERCRGICKKPFDDQGYTFRYAR